MVGGILGKAHICALARRHLNESQRGMIADTIATMKLGDNQHAQICAPSQAEAAKKLSVSRRTAQSARVVRTHGTAALQQAVEAGDISVTAAAEIARQPLRFVGEVSDFRWGPICCDWWAFFWLEKRLTIR